MTAFSGGGVYSKGAFIRGGAFIREGALILKSEISGGVYSRKYGIERAKLGPQRIMIKSSEVS